MEISLEAQRSDRSFCVRPSLRPCCGNYSRSQHYPRGSVIFAAPQFPTFSTQFVDSGRWLRAINGHSRPALHRNKESSPRLSGRIQAFERGTPFAIGYGRAHELLIARNDRRDVRECKGDNCGWLFLDHSKGGHRIWCSDTSCGTRSRIARFRTRLKPKIEEF
jgi:hypothetical protein